MGSIRCVAHGRMIGRAKLAAIADREGFPVQWTTAAKQMQAMAAAAIQQGCDRLLVAGGDGSLMEAAQALHRSTTALAVIPGGTGNDFARSLKVPKHMEEAVEIALHGQVRNIDVGVARTLVNEQIEERIFLNIAEVGFGAGVVGRMNHFARYAGKGLAYPIGILSGLLTLKKYAVDMEVDGKAMHVPALVNLVIANGRFFGRGLMPAPDAELDDGLFDILVIKNLGRLAIARRFPELKTGPPTNDPDMSTFRCRRLKISTPFLGTEADGEVLGSTSAEFEVLPKGMQVVIPQ